MMYLQKCTARIVSSPLISAFVRRFSTTIKYKSFNSPTDPGKMGRPGGIATMMRLPFQETSDGLDVCFVGIPLDVGTCNRSGTRFGPRQIRTESVGILPFNIATGAAPFESIQVADVGDIKINLYSLLDACTDIRRGLAALTKNGCKPLIIGGDHTLTYPALQAIKETRGPVGLVHVDAHSDTDDTMMGAKIAHGTPFRRAVEDGCLITNKVVQIGLRGSGFSASEYAWVEEQGFRTVFAEDCWHKSLAPLMAEIREMMGDTAVYISFDIDGLDPAFAPGTGTPEIAGLTTIQGLEIVRGCKGMNIIGGDLVEVSPPYDMAGTTALTGAQLLFEMLSVMPGVKYYSKK